MIGKVLKKLRLDKNLTQSDLSKMINIGRSTLSDYEREKTDISFDNIEKIADVCDYQVVFEKKDGKERFRAKDLYRKDL